MKINFDWLDLSWIFYLWIDCLVWVEVELEEYGVSSWRKRSWGRVVGKMCGEYWIYLGGWWVFGLSGFLCLVVCVLFVKLFVFCFYLVLLILFGWSFFRVFIGFCECLGVESLFLVKGINFWSLFRRLCFSFSFLVVGFGRGVIVVWVIMVSWLCCVLGCLSLGWGRKFGVGYLFWECCWGWEWRSGCGSLYVVSFCFLLFLVWLGWGRGVRG